MWISDIAKILGYEVVGKDYEIQGIAWSCEAQRTDIAVVRNKSDIAATKANVILTEPIIIPTEKTLLITYESIECAIAKICEVLINNEIIANYSKPMNSILNDKGYYVGKNCQISETANIQPGVVIGDNVVVEDGCIIGPYVVVGSGVKLQKNVVIDSGSQIGAVSFFHYYEDNELRQFCGIGVVIVKENTHVGCNTIIQRGTLSNTIIGKDCMIGNCIDIGHDVRIGDGCKLVSQTGIAGNVIIKDNVLVYGQVAISNDVVIGNNVVIKGRTVVSKSINDNEVVYGAFGRNYSDEMKLMIKVRKFFSRKEE